jgi:DNA-directed RNA polymerase subunit omega
VLISAKRARDIERGAQISVQRDNDKPTIIALREIAGDTISIDGLRELTKRSLVVDDYDRPEQEFVEADEVRADSEDEYIDDDDFSEEDLRILNDIDKILVQESDAPDDDDEEEEDVA